jgi:hypothetical protein
MGHSLFCFPLLQFSKTTVHWVARAGGGGPDCTDTYILCVQRIAHADMVRVGCLISIVVLDTSACLKSIHSEISVLSRGQNRTRCVTVSAHTAARLSLPVGSPGTDSEARGAVDPWAFWMCPTNLQRMT